MIYFDDSKESLSDCVDDVLTLSPAFIDANQKALFAAKDLSFMPLAAARDSALECLTELGIENLQIEFEFALKSEDMLS